MARWSITKPPFSLHEGRGKAKAWVDSDSGHCNLGHDWVIALPARSPALPDEGRGREFSCYLLSSSGGLWFDGFLDSLVLDSV
jgi:hypothetical protein